MTKNSRDCKANPIAFLDPQTIRDAVANTHDRRTLRETSTALYQQIVQQYGVDSDQTLELKNALARAIGRKFIRNALALNEQIEPIKIFSIMEKAGESWREAASDLLEAIAFQTVEDGEVAKSLRDALGLAIGNKVLPRSKSTQERRQAGLAWIAGWDTLFNPSSAPAQESAAKASLPPSSAPTKMSSPPPEAAPPSEPAPVATTATPAAPQASKKELRRRLHQNRMRGFGSLGGSAQKSAPNTPDASPSS